MSKYGVFRGRLGLRSRRFAGHQRAWQFRTHPIPYSREPNVNRRRDTRRFLFIQNLHPGDHNNLYRFCSVSCPTAAKGDSEIRLHTMFSFLLLAFQILFSSPSWYLCPGWHSRSQRIHEPLLRECHYYVMHSTQNLTIKKYLTTRANIVSVLFTAAVPENIRFQLRFRPKGIQIAIGDCHVMESMAILRLTNQPPRRPGRLFRSSAPVDNSTGLGVSSAFAGPSCYGLAMGDPSHVCWRCQSGLCHGLRAKCVSSRKHTSCLGPPWAP